MSTFEIPEPIRTPTEQAEVLISVRGASKKFCRTLNHSLRYMALDALQDVVGRGKTASLRPDEFWALRDVSFELRRGQSLGVMGLNGAGKSTLLKLMLGSLRLTEGEIALSGCLSMLSEHGLGFDPLLTGRENVYLAAAVLEIDRQRVDRAFDEIVAFAELQDFIDSPVRGYSTGMRAAVWVSPSLCILSLKSYWLTRFSPSAISVFSDVASNTHSAICSVAVRSCWCRTIRTSCSSSVTAASCSITASLSGTETPSRE